MADPLNIQYLTPLSEVDPAQDYGFDVSVFPHFDVSLSVTNSPRNVVEAVVRRWYTQRGMMPFHEDDGFDIRSFFNSDITADTLFQLKTALQFEAEKDERVLSATVVCTFVPSTFKLTIDATLELETGPFRFTLDVRSLTNELLLEQ